MCVRLCMCIHWRNDNVMISKHGRREKPCRVSIVCLRFFSERKGTGYLWSIRFDKNCDDARF